ncbi:LacI family DNA-binding transcriptional regulator [Streptomyces sp. NPDC002643]
MTRGLMTRPAKRITSSDVARAAGVSRTTVSFVLNDKPGLSIPEETRRRVLDAARELDYHPHAAARALRVGRSDIALLALPDLPIGPGISRFVEELAGALAAHGLSLVTHLESTHSRPLADVCAAINASAVLGLHHFDAETAQELRHAGAKVVLPTADPLDRTPTSAIGRIQAEHLLDRGHLRLGYALPEGTALDDWARERLDGAAQVCAARRLDPPSPLTVALDPDRAATSVDAWRRERVTAVCAYNDEVALAVLAGLHQRGLRAPEDLAVMGSDDIPAARVAVPPLTTIRYDLARIGRQRAQAVIAALAGADGRFGFESVDAPEIIARSST